MARNHVSVASLEEMQAICPPELLEPALDPGAEDRWRRMEDVYEELDLPDIYRGPRDKGSIEILVHDLYYNRISLNYAASLLQDGPLWIPLGGPYGVRHSPRRAIGPWRCSSRSSRRR